MSKELPKDLIKAFVACKKSNWADDKYAQYKELANKYLKGDANDRLEQGKLVVDLARATSSEFKESPNGKEEKTKKAKTTKKSTRNSGPV